MSDRGCSHLGAIGDLALASISEEGGSSSLKLHWKIPTRTRAIATLGSNNKVSA